MSFTVKLFLDTRRKRADKEYTIKLRITYYRRLVEVSTGYRVDERYWNVTTAEVKSRASGNTSRLNSQLQKQKTEVSDVLLDLEREEKLHTMPTQELRQYLIRKDSETKTYVYCDEVIARLKLANRIGTARSYKYMRNSVHGFMRSGKKLPNWLVNENDKTPGREKHPLEYPKYRDQVDFTLIRITTKWLHEYDAWYRSRGNSVNGLAVVMRTLRALINKARKEQMLPKDHNPFGEYRIKKEATRKRAISQAELDLIKIYEPQTDLQSRAKDYFLLSFYLMGTSFSDLVYMQMKQIREGRVEYKRQRTGGLYTIKITAPLQVILNKYTAGKSDEDYVLGILSSGTTPEEQSKAAQGALKRYNKALKTIGEVCGINAPITSYTARHSFATIAKYKGVPTAIISEAMGHKTEEITQVYLDSFNREVLDDWNEKIVL